MKSGGVRRTKSNSGTGTEVGAGARLIDESIIRSSTAPRATEIPPPKSPDLKLKYNLSFAAKSQLSIDLPPLNIASAQEKIQTAQERSPVNPALRSHHNLLRSKELAPLSTASSCVAAPKKDPFSTPARRRRLIADMAKFLLKQYYTKACKNVMIFRIESAAALLIQTALRRFLAMLRVRKLVQNRKKKAANKIIQAARIFLAKKTVQKIKAARLSQLRNSCALKIQCMLRVKIACMRAARLRAYRDAAIRQERERAARVIQYHYREFIQRRWQKVIRQTARKKRIEERLLLVKRVSAAVIIQCTARRMIAKNKVSKVRRMYRARVCIRHAILGYVLRCRFHRKRKAAIRLQKFVRLHFAKKALWFRIVQKKNRMEAINNLAEVALKIVMQNIIGETLDVIVQLLSSAETSRLMSLYRSLCHSRSINIMMSLGLPLLQELSSAGPSKVVHWSLYSGLLSFSPILGYSIGPMLAKVISAVFADDESNNDSKSNINAGADTSTESLEGPVERVIRLSQTQDTNSSMDNMPLPPEGCFPVVWGKLCRPLVELGGMRSGNVEHVDESIITSALDLTIDISSTKIDMNLQKTPTAEFLNREDLLLSRFLVVNILRDEEDVLITDEVRVMNWLHSVEVFLMPFEDEQGQRPLINSSIPTSSMIHSPLEFNEIVDLDDYMFHLRDAVVLVSTKPPAPVENLGDCYAEDNEEDNNIAVVRILVEQEPILPDYEFLASKIQRYCHMWYLHRKTSAKIIQSVFRTFWRLKKWKFVAYSALNRANLAAISIQRITRGRLGEKTVKILRMKVLSEMVEANIFRVEELVNKHLSESRPLAGSSKIGCPRFFTKALNFEGDEPIYEEKYTLSLLPGLFWGTGASNIVSVLTPPNCIQISSSATFVGVGAKVADSFYVHGKLNQVDKSGIPDAPDKDGCPGRDYSPPLPPLYKKLLAREFRL